MPPTATMAQVSTKILNSPLNNNSIPKVGYQLGRDNVGLRLTQQNKNTISMVRRQPLPWYYQLPLEQTTDSDSNWVSFSVTLFLLSKLVLQNKVESLKSSLTSNRNKFIATKLLLIIPTPMIYLSFY